MSRNSSTSQQRVIPLKQQKPIGGAVIDAEGREIPITEKMIQKACRELDKAWVSAPKHD
ncbi:PA1571 family protein [Pseudomonas cavernae]|uniref:PA1571 family protein n=1 Tax=Pseudomonas cavernae TaxID=2320867 RepID=UPI0013C48333|nr:PA1571 family protein [Pseudomonas cavernae]